MPFPVYQWGWYYSQSLLAHRVFNIKSKKGPSWCRETWQLRDRVFSGQHGWRRDDQEGFRVRCSLNKLKSRCYERREAPLQRELNKKGVVLSMIEIANGKWFAKSIWPLPISGEIITLFQQDLGLPSWWKECSRLYHAPRMQEEREVHSSSFSSGSAYLSCSRRLHWGGSSRVCECLVWTRSAHCPSARGPIVISV